MFAISYVAKKILPRFIVSELRRLKLRNRGDEVAMVASLCEKIPTGVMIDVGAHFGGSAKEFLDLGWIVVAYEPDPKNRSVLEMKFGKHPRLQISDCAVSSEEKSDVQFFSSKISTGISGLSAFHSTHVPSATVNSVRLDNDLQSRGVTKVDFLKIDVEGYDFFALQSFNWAEPPRFVLYEFENKKTLPLGYQLSDSTAFMSARGYYLLYSIWEPITEYGAEHTWRGLFLEPPADVELCWGNVMCFRRTTDRDACLQKFSRETA